jgi:hypothetical protein
VAVVVVVTHRSWRFLKYLGSVTKPNGRKVLNAHTTAAAVTFRPAAPERPEAA